MCIYIYTHTVYMYSRPPQRPAAGAAAAARGLMAGRPASRSS